VIILGIDPGTVRVGYGVVRREGARFSHVESGLFDVRGSSLTDRLVTLSRSLDDLLGRHDFSAGGVERLYFTTNQKTAISVAQARGVIILGLGRCGVPVHEVAPTEVKASLTSNGRATKDAVARMVGYFLGMDMDGVIDDVADALAVAITVGGMRNA